MEADASQNRCIYYKELYDPPKKPKKNSGYIQKLRSRQWLIYM